MKAVVWTWESSAPGSTPTQWREFREDHISSLEVAFTLGAEEVALEVTHRDKQKTTVVRLGQEMVQFCEQTGCARRVRRMALLEP